MCPNDLYQHPLPNVSDRTILNAMRSWLTMRAYPGAILLGTLRHQAWHHVHSVPNNINSSGTYFAGYTTSLGKDNNHNLLVMVDPVLVMISNG